MNWKRTKHHTSMDYIICLDTSNYLCVIFSESPTVQSELCQNCRCLSLSPPETGSGKKETKAYT